MYKNILTAIDISAESEQVLQAAKRLGDVYGAEISVIHVADNPRTFYPSVYGEIAGYDFTFDEQTFRQSLVERVAKLAQPFGIESDHVSVEFGSVTNQVVEKAANLGTDLIVLGSHGRHGIQLLLGSTANGVLHHAECDVLAVRVKEDS
ncbi:universal stress protein [Exilibacterium tricleocarpae]|uniref:Universal stress protein n=1 Tax=Exilibacterium tricleocarpae TaxID=2591008 RepID=A0A545SZ10_9GAMM|nr:universal stress protein [Exilibacterium tricleocarpae]TQV70169.1 universal stress protein [Exilibacterium tricleocarpae]